MKTHRITVRLTDNELFGLEAMKKQMKLRGVSELVREAVDQLLKSDQPQLTRDLVDEFKTWRKEFHGVGSNLNQIAYHINADHPLSSRQIIETLDELRGSFKALAMNMKSMRNDLNI